MKELKEEIKKKQNHASNCNFHISRELDNGDPNLESIRELSLYAIKNFNQIIEAIDKTTLTKK